MKILVLGGAGFIGYHLCRYLREKGHEVRGVDNFFHPCEAPDNEAEYADVRYQEEIRPFVKWADVVIHLAAVIHVDRSMKFPHETVDINVNGTLNVLEECRMGNKRMIFASSSEVYGTSQTDAMDEKHPLDAQSPYAASKVAGDRLCKSYVDSFGSKVVILRNFNIFGEWQADDSYGGVIAKFTRSALEGRPLYVYGDGLQERDYMHVSDAVRIYDLCLGIEEFGRPINMGTGQTVRIGDLARLIVEYAESDSPIENVEPRPGEVRRLCADITKAKSLGLYPKTDLERDLKKYVQFFKQHQLGK